MTTTLRLLIDAIASCDDETIDRLLDDSPALAREALGHGATRQDPGAHFIEALQCYAYEGDTALHFAAAAYRVDLVRRLIERGVEVGARNRMGDTPLHHVAVGDPASPRWQPEAQAETIAALIAAGADPNAVDRNGTAPLHRAVRTRCAAAVRALLAGGADPNLVTKNGSTAARLAEVSSGRSGGGSLEAKAQQAEIQRLLGVQ